MFHGSLNVPMFHITQPLDSIRYMVYNGYYKVMSNIPKMGHLPTPVFGMVKLQWLLVSYPCWMDFSQWRPWGRHWGQRHQQPAASLRRGSAGGGVGKPKSSTQTDWKLSGDCRRCRWLIARREDFFPLTSAILKNILVQAMCQISLSQLIQHTG